MNWVRWLWLCCFGASALWGHAAPAQHSKLKVLTSILPIYCFTANVAGDLAEVSNLLPPGVGPHDYQLSPKDRRKLSEADLIVLNGLQLEAWVYPLLRSDSSLRSKTVTEAAADLGVNLIYGTAPLDGGTDPAATPSPVASSGGAEDRRRPNPHVWLDPRLACQAVTNILRALQKADPARAAGYASNAARYAIRLQQLDEEIGRTLEAVQGRSIITQHDAFAYFARRYALPIAGVIELVPEVQPSPKYLAALCRVARERKVKAIFTEPQFSPNLARQLGRDLGVAVASLDTLESGPLNPTAYETGMRQNVRVLQKYLE
jgi:zinc/manganese transport system substrate-binding protein